MPSIYFSIGGYDPKAIAEPKAAGKPLPVNHSPFFVEAMTLAVVNVAQGGW